MRIKNITITILPGKLSEIEADAYVLSYYPYHVNPDHERQEVESAGAKGVRSFVEQRLRHQINKQRLSLGDVFLVDSNGGKSRKLINVICRDEDDILVRRAIHRGLIGMFSQSGEHGLKKVAMVPLCSSDGFPASEFMRILKNFIEKCIINNSIEEIVIICKDESQVSELKAICQE